MPSAESTNSIARRYEVGTTLGRGGMGTVRAGVDLVLDREVAIKFLRDDLAAQPNVRLRFEREARAAARISHPHVVAIYDIGEHDGLPFIVMERLPGSTLADELTSGPLSQSRTRSVALEILGALDAAHRLGVIHRDIKPGNVLLTDGEHIKVADFGIAKLADEADRTTTGMLLGTAGDVAPERLEGNPATPASDVYSVGVLLYEALTGRPPFSGETPLALIASISNGDPLPLAGLRDDLAPDLVAVVERAMRKRPAERFDSAGAMAAALAAAPEVRASAIDTPTAPVAGSAADVATWSAQLDNERRDAAMTDVLIDSGHPPERLAPSKSPQGRRRRIVVVAAVLVTMFALGLLAVVGPFDDTGTPSAPPTSTTLSPDNPVPAPLQRALDDLDRAIQP